MQVHPSSYRDSGTQVFVSENEVYRKINKSYLIDFQHFIDSKLSENLTKKNLILPYEVIEKKEEHWIIKPSQISFENYPYEWSFEQLKRAAILTLEIMSESLEKGLVLKDADPTNLMFVNGKPVFIDHGSFIKLVKGDGWVAYKQFLETFLAPLAIASYRGRTIKSIFLENIKGIDLKSASSILPWKSKFSLGLQVHIHGAAKYIYSSGERKANMSLSDLKKLIRHLTDTVLKLEQSTHSVWSNYYELTHEKEYYAFRWNFLEKRLDKLKPIQVLDLGANTGFYTQKIAEKGFNVMGLESDPIAVNAYYLDAEKRGNLFHLDVCNLSGATGVLNLERKRFLDRNNSDFVLALALIHHLYFTSMLSLAKITDLLYGLTSKYVVLEWVELEDEMCQKVKVEARVEGYSKEVLLEELEKRFEVLEIVRVEGKERSLLLLETYPLN